MKKLISMVMLSLMLVTLVATQVPAPASAVIDVYPRNGGEWTDTGQADPNFQWNTTGGSNTNQPTQPPAPVSNAEIKIYVNGALVNADVPSFVDNAYRTQAPFRAIGEALGCKVTWLGAVQSVICEKPGFKVVMTIGKKDYFLNSIKREMDTAPMIKNNRTFIPVRALSEALNCNVVWDENTNTVNITNK